MTIGRPVKKRKTFKSGFTKELIILECLALLVSGYLILYGIIRIQFFNAHKIGGTVDCLIAGYLPIAIGAVILIIGAALLLKGLNQYIVITPQSLAYQKGKSTFKEDWDKLVYRAPHYAKKRLRAFHIGTENKLVRIDAFFFPKFDTLLEVIKVAKESRKTKLMQEGVDIDKG